MRTENNKGEYDLTTGAFRTKEGRMLNDAVDDYIPQLTMNELKELIDERVREALIQEKENSIALISVRENDCLATRIAARLGKPLINMDIVTFGDGEKKCWIKENLRGRHVYVISTIGLNEDPDVSLANTMKVLSALKRTCKVKTINVIAPCLWYQAQDKAHSRREPITVRT